MRSYRLFMVSRSLVNILRILSVYAFFSETGWRIHLEGDHTSQMEMTSGGPKSLDLLGDLDEVMQIIGQGFTIKHARVETVELDESDLHRGPVHVVRLHLIKI